MCVSLSGGSLRVWCGELTCVFFVCVSCVAVGGCFGTALPGSGLGHPEGDQRAGPRRPVHPWPRRRHRQAHQPRRHGRALYGPWLIKQQRCQQQRLKQRCASLPHPRGRTTRAAADARVTAGRRARPRRRTRRALRTRQPPRVHQLRPTPDSHTDNHQAVSIPRAHGAKGPTYVRTQTHACLHALSRANS